MKKHNLRFVICYIKMLYNKIYNKLKIDMIYIYKGMCNVLHTFDFPTGVPFF